MLDPAQNHTFRDHYLEVDLDLSDVVFIATANVVDTIPGPLLDRMEVVRLDGYTEDEKVVIARDHLLPAQLERNGLRADEVVADRRRRSARVVTDYTREAGVRSLERELGQAARARSPTKVADRTRTIGAGRTSTTATSSSLTSAARSSTHEAAERTAVPGVATGLAVTGTRRRRAVHRGLGLRRASPALTLTGQLGDVMKESAQIALVLRAVARRRARHRRRARSNRRFHVHVPAGAVPKDGPSAGVTMTTALVSLLTDRPVQADGRHDRRGHAAGQGAADRRREAEGARRPPRRADRGRAAQAQRPRPRRRARAGARVMTFHLADDVARRPRRRARLTGERVAATTA